MSDTISRAAAINAICEDGTQLERQGQYSMTMAERKQRDADTFYKAVNEKGGGVNEDTPYFTEDDVACSECLTLFSVLENRTEMFDFCPHCGSYNGGDNDA